MKGHFPGHPRLGGMDQRLLLVHAHPDDETIGQRRHDGAATPPRGAQVTLVTCTLGEEGEVLVPELEHLAADQRATGSASTASPSWPTR